MTTHTTSQPGMHASGVTWRVPPWAYLPLGAAIVAEAVSNALRAYGLGAHLDRFTVTVNGASVSLAGSVLVLAAVAVSLSQARAAWIALTPNPLRQRIVAGAAAALLLAVSVTAMASHILEAQRAKVADEGGARGAYDRAEAAYKRAAAELEALGTPRPVSVIQAEVKAFKIDGALWRRSKQCEDATKPDTQAYCEPILALYKERGAAARKTELEPEVARLRDELARLPRPAVATAEEAVIGGYWAWIMGLAVVFVATFGSVIFARVSDRATVADLWKPGKPWPGTLAQPSVAETLQSSFAHAGLLDNRENQRKPGNRDHGGNGNRRGPRPDNPRNAGPHSGRPFSKPEAERDIVTLLATGATVDEQNDLAQRWSVHKGTVSKWLTEWRERGLVPLAQRVGRCNVIRPMIAAE